METKAQNAAKEKVDKRVKNLIRYIKVHPDHIGIPNENVEGTIEKIKEMIKEHNLDEKVLANALEEIYEGLRSAELYEYAAFLAKKYSL